METSANHVFQLHIGRSVFIRVYVFSVYMRVKIWFQEKDWVVYLKVAFQYRVSQLQYMYSVIYGEISLQSPMIHRDRKKSQMQSCRFHNMRSRQKRSILASNSIEA
jgi:hypothetical protein